ncbi:PAS domain-containing protein, partial [Magnetococcus sp. PR-3]|uniref:PAS domain-containing protein n=1 Tax=Magnetococcus sp. PR-3 TaxID=3120355 RepID=UPI002FCDEABE
MGEDLFQTDYRLLFERSADAMLLIDGQQFMDCNQATVDMLGYPNRQQLLDTHPSELSPPQQPDGQNSFDKANEMIAQAMRKGSHRFEWTHRRANGEDFPVEVLLTVIPFKGREILHTAWRDITERKAAEASLRLAKQILESTSEGVIVTDLTPVII